jgi:hypothetical protein
MNRTPALLLLVAVCLVLAFLILIEVVTPLISGLVFAAALVTLGIVSKGFLLKRA